MADLGDGLEWDDLAHAISNFGAALTRLMPSTHEAIKAIETTGKVGVRIET